MTVLSNKALQATPCGRFSFVISVWFHVWFQLMVRLRARLSLVR
jgi:hypothetical protein